MCNNNRDLTAEGCFPPFLIVQGAYYLADWDSENDPRNWVFKITPDE